MEKEMAQNLVVQHNILNQARYKLSLTEKRLMLLAIVESRENGVGITSDTLLHIHARRYSQQFSISENTAYEVLNSASNNLFNRYLKYTDIDPRDNKEREFKIRWVDKIGYKKAAGEIYLRFTEEVASFITRLGENFTSYEIDNMSQLNSVYSIRLYELLMQWQSVGHTPVMDLIKFRQHIGLDDNEYSRMSDFKKHVLDISVEQINKLTDIEVYNPSPNKNNSRKVLPYIQIKKGRELIGFQFYFRKKKVIEGKCKDISKKRDANTPDFGLTDNEQAIAQATADKHIKNNSITDPQHKINIHAKAQKERWGLGEHDKEIDDYNLQNQQVTQQIEADKAKEQAEKEAMALQKQSNEQFISNFENLSNDEQQRILDNVEASVSNIPVLGDIFRKNRQAGTAHKDISFRSQFKNAMS